MFMSETACFILVTFGIDCLTWHIGLYWSGITPAVHYIQSEHKRTYTFNVIQKTSAAYLELHTYTS
jgi:hypothetical protein